MNKHVRVTVEISPEVRDPGSYQGRHQLDSTKHGEQIWLGCSICVSGLKHN